MPDRVRICIVGLGWTGSNHLAGSRAISERAEVVAAVVRSEEGQARARAAGIPRIRNDWRAALDDPEIDAIDFCTPSFLHAEQSVAALEAGKHVFCETPACHTLEEARRIRWAIMQHPDLVAATGHVARCWPTFEHAHRLVEAGEIGRVFMVEANYAHKPDPDEYPSARTWGRDITKRARLGAAHHAIDLLRWFAGDVYEVTGDQTRQASLAVLRFESGALGKIFTSNAVVQPYDLSVVIYGDQGTIVTRWEELELRGLVHRSANWAPEYLERTPLHGRGSPEWAREMAGFVDAILGRRQPPCPMTDGIAAVETGLAIQQAMDLGVRVRVVRAV